MGFVGAPSRPFVVGYLPGGWRVATDNRQLLNSQEREIAERHRVVLRQSLYLPAGSSPTRGPALLVGYSGESEWSVLECDPPRTIGAPTPVPGDRAPAHWGNGYSAMHSREHPSEIDTEAVGYVVGRDLDDATLTSVAHSVRWDIDGDVTGSPPWFEVPSGFRLVGTGSLATHGFSFTPVEKLMGPRDRDWFAISQEADNDAALAVARFWSSASAGQTCGGYAPIIEATLIRDNIVIRAIGPDNRRVRAAMRKVLRNLTRAPAS